MEESFDLALVASLEIDVVPHLGDSRVPDYIIAQLARVLQQGSRIRETDDYRPPSPISPGNKLPEPSFEFDKIGALGEYGSNEVGLFQPRERFSYWCFDLLVLICSDTTKGMSRCVARTLKTLICHRISHRSGHLASESSNCGPSLVA